MRILPLLQSLTPLRLWLAAVAASILLTEAIVSCMGLLLLGSVTWDYLLTGLVASGFVASLVSAVIIYFLRQLEETNSALEIRVREELRRSREKDHLLMQQSRLAAMGEVITNIAHHWRQPLNILALVVQNIRFDYADRHLTEDSLEEYVATAMQTINGMSATIDDFRGLCAPDEPARDFNLSHAVQEALRLVALALEPHAIAVEVSGSTDVVIHGYHNEMSRVLLGLVANARDAMAPRPAGGKLRIVLEDDGEEARVIVRDNGGGIPEEILPRIFDPYFSTKAQSTGLGLYLAKTMAEGMGGSLRAANIEGGAEFCLTLPIAPVAQVSPDKDSGIPVP